MSDTNHITDETVCCCGHVGDEHDSRGECQADIALGELCPCMYFEEDE